MGGEKSSRREFIGTVAIGITGARLAAPMMADASETTKVGDMPYRVLGRSGEKVSLLGLGGYLIGTQRDEAESIRFILAAVESSVNFIDTCWDYYNGSR